MTLISSLKRSPLQSGRLVPTSQRQWHWVSFSSLLLETHTRQHTRTALWILWSKCWDGHSRIQVLKNNFSGWWYRWGMFRPFFKKKYFKSTKWHRHPIFISDNLWLHRHAPGKHGDSRWTSLSHNSGEMFWNGWSSKDKADRLLWCTDVGSGFHQRCLDRLSPCCQSEALFWNGNAVFAVLVGKTPLCWICARADNETVFTS